MTKFRERLLQFGAGWHPVDRGSSNLQPITTRQHKSQRTERHIYGGEGKHFQLKAFGCDLLRGMMSFILGDQRCLTDWRSISFSLRLALIPLHSFLFFLPHTHSHTHCLNTLSSLRISSLSGKEMGLNFLSFLHIWRGALDTGAVVEWRRESCCDALLNVSESAEWQPFELKHLNDAFVLPGRGDGKKEWERKVAPSCSGVPANPALMPPGLHIIISDRSSVSRAFIPAGWKWSLWLLFFGPLPSIPPQFRWLCSVGDAGRSAATSSKSFNFTPCSAASNPPIPQGPSVNPCKIHPPHLPWYVSFFLTLIAPLFPILPALTVSVWVFCWVKNALALSLSLSLSLTLTFAPSVFCTLFFCFFPTFQCECVWWAQAVESVS